MTKRNILLLVGVLAAVVVLWWLFTSRKNSLTSPALTNNQTQQVVPSQTLKAYTDPSGFSFNYPDNLSILPNELKDTDTYAQLQLTAKGIDGGLSLKIADSQLKEVEEGQEVNLGNLKAKEVESKDKLMLNALDSGVLFTIEANFGSNKDFWISVYKSVLQDFAFAPPVQDSTALQGTDDSDAVSFEGEEVVE